MVHIKFFSIFFLCLASALVVFAIPSSPVDNDELDNVFMDRRGNIEFGNANNRMVKRHATRVHLVDDLSKRQSGGFNFGKDIVRGVNLGGWLLLESFITPSIFDSQNDGRIVDQWSLCKYGKNVPAILENHFSTFIVEDDFRQIAAAGLNLVRIPIGWWSLKQSSTYYKGSAYDKLKAAVGWAQTYGIKVVIDLHGAQGNQNPFDNSGHRNSMKWFTDEKFKTYAVEIIQQIARDFANSPSVVAIDVLNEPATGIFNTKANRQFTMDYYRKAYQAVRASMPNAEVILDYAFLPLSYFNNKFNEPAYNGVTVDNHVYTIFSNDQIAYSMNDRMAFYCNNVKGSLIGAKAVKSVIVGEYSAVINDCAYHVNGIGAGSRYDGTLAGSKRIGSCNGLTGNGQTFSNQYKAQLKQSFETQRKVYETYAGGSIFWTWNNARSDEWSYKALLGLGVIPSPLTSNYETSFC